MSNSSSLSTVKFDARRFMQNLDKDVRQTTLRMGIIFERHWQWLQRQPKSGRLYQRGRKFHQASKEGEAPAVDRGTLTRSVRRTITQRRLCSYELAISWQVVYIRFLEFGTKYMEERPSVRPALHLLRADMRSVYQRLQRNREERSAR